MQTAEKANRGKGQRGLSRQRVNTALRALADEGLVKLEHLRVTITDLKGLRGYVNRA